MIVRNISEAKAELPALVEAVLAGDEVIVARAGKPVAKLVRYQGPGVARQPGAMAGEIQILPGFDELPTDPAESLGMKDARTCVSFWIRICCSGG